MVSPLTMDVDSTDAVMWLTEQGLPVYTTVVPNAGLTAPMTMMGCLVVGNAEFLAITAFQQMVREATPVIYASLPTVADMRSGAYAPGAIETGILLAAQAQLARFYNVPAGGYIGLTNAHFNDAQSGFETGMNTLLGVTAGATLLNMGGLFSSLMAFDFAKAVVDNEIALMDKRVHRGLEFSEENLALDEIAAVGPGGSYMGRKHTKARMRTTAVLPKLAARDMRAPVGGARAGRTSTAAPWPKPGAFLRSPIRPCGTRLWTRPSATTSPTLWPATRHHWRRSRRSSNGTTSVDRAADVRLTRLNEAEEKPKWGTEPSSSSSSSRSSTRTRMRYLRP